MIAGIGTDLCDIRRIQALLDKFPDRFADKVFTKHEQEYAKAQSNPAASYAKRFAAKEATAKALAGQKTGALSWQDVEVKNHPSGKPEIILHGKAIKRVQTALDTTIDYKIHLSLSDDYPYAQAFVILEIL